MSDALDCRQFEEWLSDLEAGSLPPEHAAALRQHARECAACADLQEALRQTAVWLAELPRLELPPRLIPAVMQRTMGRREAIGWRATMGSLGRLIWQPRVAMSFGMAIFALAVLVNATGVNLRNLQWRDLTPRHIALNAERGMHRGWARGAKYYNDLKVVYEIQAALHAVWQNPPAQPATGPQHHNRIHPPSALRGSGPEMASAAEPDRPAARS